MSTVHPSSHPAGAQDQAGNFEDGLKSIVENCEAQLGRPLTADEHASIARQARSFFDARLPHPSLDLPSSSITQPNHQPIHHAAQESLPVPPDQADPETCPKPPYPTDFYAVVKLISDSSNSDNPTELLQNLINQNKLALDGLKTIPNTLNRQKPLPPVLANQVGAGKKPWEAALDHPPKDT